MAATSSGSISVVVSGDKTLQESFDFASNAAADGGETTHVLSSGANTITVPTAFTVKGCIIRPPSGNTQTITLKGVTGDTGISLHLTDPQLLRFGTAPASFVLTAGGTITGLRILWV